jgi:hypothetical protein
MRLSKAERPSCILQPGSSRYIAFRATAPLQFHLSGYKIAGEINPTRVILIGTTFAQGDSS